jgi:hypothetical protein
VTAGLSLFVPSDNLTIPSLVAIVGGLYFFVVGFRLLARKRLLLSTPSSKIRSAAMGLVEVNGAAAGPRTLPAPITGKPCFLYHTIAWQQRAGKKQDWEKVADETLHVPFFVDDSTGQLLIEPLGAELDLHRDFREEYAPSFFSSNLEGVPPRVSVFLSRHGIIPSRRLRIEERSIKPEDALFIAGTLTENPGVKVQPSSPRDNSAGDGFEASHSAGIHFSVSVASGDLSRQHPRPQIINLSGGAVPSTAQDMTQQAKIAAALNRAGIIKPEAWSAAGIPYQPGAVEENAQPAMSVANDGVAFREARIHPDSHDSSVPDLTPVVLMKGENNPTFVISFRSQKEFLGALAWKSAAMVWGGAAGTLLGLYVLLAQMQLL